MVDENRVMEQYVVDVYLSGEQMQMGIPKVRCEVEAQSEEEAVLRVMEWGALSFAWCVVVRRVVECPWWAVYGECRWSETGFSYAWRLPVFIRRSMESV